MQTMQLEKSLPIHSLLFVKSIASIKFDDSRPASLRAAVTWKSKHVTSLGVVWLNLTTVSS